MAPEHQTFDSNLPCLIPVSGAFLKCLSVEVHFQFSLQMLCYSQMRCLLSLEVGRYWCVQKAESINSIQGRLRALALRLERTSACFVVPCLAVSDSGTSRTAARQAPLSLGFPRQEYWSGLPFLLQGIFLTQGSNLRLLQCRRPGFDLWVQKTHSRREWQPTPVFLPGKSQGQRNLVSHSPWGHKESDATE